MIIGFPDKDGNNARVGELFKEGTKIQIECTNCQKYEHVFLWEVPQTKKEDMD